MTTIWQEALARLQGNDLLQLGMDADAVRSSLRPERVVTYTVGHEVVLGLSESWLAEAEAAIERGAHGFVLSAAPGADLALVTAGLRLAASTFPGVALTGFSPAEITRLSHDASIEKTFEQLHDSGLTAFGSNHDDAAVQAWPDVHRAAHRARINSTAVLPLRSAESPQEWIAMLAEVAEVQGETHGFLACEPRIEHLERALDEVTGARYLQFVALARIYLPHVPHIQADWSILGPKVLQLALRFGADDAGFVPASARNLKIPSHHSGEEELRRIIREAGFAASQRDAVYGTHFVY